MPTRPLRPSLRSPHALALALLVGVFLFLTLGGVLSGQIGLTYDEPHHFRYGERILDGSSDRFDDSKMPFSVLNVLASRSARLIAGDGPGEAHDLMLAGRTATILFSLGLGLLLYEWAGSLYGRGMGLVAFGLYALEPNVIAHSQLITTDIYAAGTITLTLFLFSRFLKEPCPSRGLAGALALGLCQVAKYTGVFMYPLLVLLTIAWHWPGLAEALGRRDRRRAGQYARSFVAYGALFLLVSILVVNVAFLFNGTGTPAGGCEFKSALFQSMARTPWLESVPIPVPYPYLEGLDLVFFNERTAESYGPVYLLGELRDGGFKGYFLVASLFKVPLPILGLFCVSFLDLLRKRGSREEVVFLLIPASFFAVYFNLFFRAQIGIRFFLVAFPVLLVFSVRILRGWGGFGRGRRGLVVVSGLYLVVSVLSYFPHHLSYFNELVVDRRYAYRILADSNLDWGQNDALIEEALRKHPEYVFEPRRPRSGLLVVSANRLTGVLGPPERYAWLRESFSPVGHIHYTHLVFDVSASELEQRVRRR